jgi:phosphoesterase RecJ-like protein
MKKFSHIAGDTEGFVNLPFSIRGIKVTALMIEKKDHIRLSFRSKGSIDINHFAGLYFNGGGHRNAAGGESYATMKETISRFEQLIREYLSKNQ